MTNKQIVDAFKCKCVLIDSDHRSRIVVTTLDYDETISTYEWI
jgi:hypothetical protein